MIKANATQIFNGQLLRLVARHIFMILLNQCYIHINSLIGNQGDVYGNWRHLQRMVAQNLLQRLIKRLLTVK
jgi:hypothetical protein